MKSAVLREFFSDVLKARGAKTSAQGAHLLDVRVPKPLRDRLGDEELHLAFSTRGLQQSPEADLATAGHPLFDRILELALEDGEAGQRFLSVPSSRIAKARAGALDPRSADPAVGELTFRGPEPVYAPVIFHVFRVRYSLEEVPDDLEVIPIDAVSLRALAQHPDLPDYWETLEADPADKREVVAAFPLADEVLQAALQTLEHRLRKRLQKIRKTARQHLDREAENIRSYYQQLIEETKKDGRRAGGNEAREQKIHLLQLDWRRRTEEAQSFWRPRVDVSLVVAASVQRPCLAFHPEGAGVPGKKKRPRSAPAVYYDIESGGWRVASSLLGTTLPS